MRLVWNQFGETQYEVGVDRGVFYDSNSKGHVWNGLTEVNESAEGGDLESHHFDGIKYLDRVTPRHYQATISGFSAPEVFSTALGEESVIPGMILTRQARTLFGLSYRTSVGRPDGYKIHIVYNVIASVESRAFTTISDSSSPDVFSWKISAVPPNSIVHRPSAHYIFDSKSMASELLETFEDMLYGTDTSEPYLPTIDEIRDLLGNQWAPLVIVADPVTGLSGLIAGDGDLFVTFKPGVNRALPESRLEPSEIPGLYRLE